MSDMLVFGFHYKERFYKAIANLWKKSTNGIYRITVMNGDLERLLFGNNIVSLKEGRFLATAGTNVADMEIKQLQEALVIALNDHRARN
ncbi:MAG: hypothetical protein ACTHMC_12610 [Pseudobacter sp.]|uniref:hypothetical protein n=1 Tax=Pseudobacter sp. TaxID=2045420 RepID=UPI003F7D6AE9